jgi:hypothetical protein
MEQTIIFLADLDNLAALRCFFNGSAVISDNSVEETLCPFIRHFTQKWGVMYEFDG